MTPHYTDPLVTLHLGDCLDVMRELPDASVDSVVTDPPYGLEFMGKSWDRLGDVGTTSHSGPSATAGGERGQYGKISYGDSANRRCRKCGHWAYSGTPCKCDIPDFPSVANAQSLLMQEWHNEWATEAFRVLKPGGYLLAFGGTRTYHRLASAIEDAGFEIRDTLMWIYASGFPKSLNLTGEWEGWGTALKPAHEPIVMARKPLTGTVAQNVTRYGTGALNIDGSRITANGRPHRQKDDGEWVRPDGPEDFDHRSGMAVGTTDLGRWPSNVLLSSPELFDEPNPGVVGSGATSAAGFVPEDQPRGRRPGGFGDVGADKGDPRPAGPMYGDGGGYSRFFAVPRYSQRGEEGPDSEYPTAYLIPKADRAERERGLAEIALRLHRERGECDKLRAWESQGRSPSEQTDSTSPARATSDAPAPEAATSSSATSSPGKPSTDPSRTATRSTTSTGTSRTTTSETSSSLTPLPTSEFTPAASLWTESGGSPAPSASSSDPSSPSGGTSPRRDGPSTDDADPATSARWSSRNACADCGKPLPRGSSHPTVKPIDLMRHLVRLVTPPGGVCLDPFAGSGTTAVACSEEGVRNISIERESEYIEIAKGRLMATPMGLGLDVPAGQPRPPKTHPDLSKHQPKRRAPIENYTGGWAGTEDDAA